MYNPQLLYKTLPYFGYLNSSSGVKQEWLLLWEAQGG
jgi:hypothetical protein